MDSTPDVTHLLQRAGEGDRAALDEALPLVYEHLRHMAHRQLQLEAVGHTLSTTGLVHEAYLRLVDQTRSRWRDRAHFLAIAATAMRRILVDHARRHHAAKRGAGARPVPLESLEGLPWMIGRTCSWHSDGALARLAALDARQARIVECRFFGGLTEDETAEVLGISPRTAKRDWAKARSWLYQEMYPDVVS